MAMRVGRLYDGAKKSKLIELFWTRPLSMMMSSQLIRLQRPLPPFWWAVPKYLPVDAKSIDRFLISFYACFNLSAAEFLAILNRQYKFRNWWPIISAPWVIWVIVTSSIWPTGIEFCIQRYHNTCSHNDLCIPGFIIKPKIYGPSLRMTD